MKYGPGFVLPDDSVASRWVFEGVESLDPRIRFGEPVPRIFTPPLRELTPETSWGFSVIEFARDVLEIELMPFQRWLVIHLLELRPGGDLRFQNAFVLIARQNGKSTLSQVLALWFLLVRRWPLVLGAAQDLATAEKVWEGAVALMEDDPDLAPLIAHVSKVNGAKALKLKGRLEYVVKAASRSAGRGLSANLIILDELREQRNWEAWGALTKTTQAQKDLLILGLSNAGDLSSVVLRHFRLKAHAFLGDPDGIVGDGEIEATRPIEDIIADDEEFEDPEEAEPDGGSIFLAEWSAAPDVPLKDRAGWAQANPALGHRIQIRKLREDADNDTEWVFRTEVLCQWSDGSLEGPFPAGAWEKGLNEPLVLPDGSKTIRPEDRLVGKVFACVDQSHDRSMSYVAFAGFRADGKPQVEIRAARYNTDWVAGWLMERRDQIRFVTGQSKGAPVSALMEDLRGNPKFSVPVVDWSGGDLIAGHGLMFDAVRDGEVRHNEQPPLDLAAATAALRPLGDGGFVVDRRKSPADAAPLVAFTGALWLLLRQPASPPPPPLPPSAIESESNADSFGASITGDVMSIAF